MLDSVRRVLESDSRIAYALVFGSSARGTAHARSDLDLAIGLRPGKPLEVREIGTLVSALESAAGIPVHREVFAALSARGVLTRELADRMAAASGLRNLVAHQYGEVDWNRIHAMASSEVGELLAFTQELARASGR